MDERLCIVCGKGDADLGGELPNGGMVYIHEACAFTEDELTALMKLKHSITPNTQDAE